MADTSGKDIVLIGGLWLPPTVWDATASALRAAGHHVQAVTLPGQGDDNANATLDDQLTAVLEAIDSASGAPLVVGHSAACADQGRKRASATAARILRVMGRA